MSQLVQTPSKECAASVKDALFCMWLKRHPRLECVHQLSIQPCTLTPLASLCLPVRGSGGWQVDPWPSPQPYLSFRPSLVPPFIHMQPLIIPPLLFFILSRLSKSTVFLLTLLLSQVQGLAGRLHWGGNLCPSVLIHHVLGLQTTLWCASKVAPKFGDIAHCVQSLLASVVPWGTFKGSKKGTI